MVFKFYLKMCGTVVRIFHSCVRFWSVNHDVFPDISFAFDMISRRVVDRVTIAEYFVQ